LGSDIIFITAGMGGGTGTGVAPVLAQIAHRNKALSVAVVTSPFPFEGLNRNTVARQGIKNLQEQADTLIVVPNERLLKIVDKNLSLEEAYQAADDVLRQSVQSLAELVKHDFAYVRSAMTGGLSAYLAMGRASGKDRARLGAEKALSNLLLDVTLQEARRILFYINGGTSLTLAEIDEAVGIIRQAAHSEADITFRSAVDTQLGEDVCIYLLATGYEAAVKDSKPVALPAEKQVAAAKPEEINLPEFSEPITTAAVATVKDAELPSFLRGRSKPVPQPVKEGRLETTVETPASPELPTTPAPGAKRRKSRQTKKG